MDNRTGQKRRRTSLYQNWRRAVRSVHLINSVMHVKTSDYTEPRHLAARDKLVE
jgi:hypothetical protein